MKRRSARALAVVISLALATPLAVAVTLTPDPSGSGTHRQLGLSPCNVLVLTGYPCPTCGMTTAFSLAVRGRWLAGLQTQPLGLLCAFAAMIGSCLAATAAVTGRFYTVNWYRIPPNRVMIGVLLLFVTAWGYKIWAVRASAPLP